MFPARAEFADSPLRRIGVSYHTLVINVVGSFLMGASLDISRFEIIYRDRRARFWRPEFRRVHDVFGLLARCRAIFYKRRQLVAVTL
jgi:hypothetical protein